MSNSFQALFDAFAAGAKAAGLKDKPIITLGRLIALLHEQGRSLPVKVQWGESLRGYGSVDSYRGYYSDLAITGSEGGDCTVQEALKDLQDAVGETFTGYKGGDYTMGQNTLVWVSGYGECSGLGVTGVEFVDGTVVITSAQMDH